MGVPVISLRVKEWWGDYQQAFAYSGFDQWIAINIDNYINIAKNLAMQGPRSVDERIQLRNKLQHSALADGKRLATELERIYTTLRQRSASANACLDHGGKGQFE